LNRVVWATFVTFAVLVTIALGIALGVGAPDPGAIERAAAAAVGLLGLGAGSVAVSSAVEAGRPSSRRSHPLDAESTDAGTANLVALERSLRFGASTAGDFYARVRPRLVALAKSRLAGHGVSLSERDRAVQLLGADEYELVDPSGSPPADRFAPGVSIDRVDRLLDRLEALGTSR